jgi:hypothetical protein
LYAISKGQGFQMLACLEEYFGITILMKVVDL